MSFTPEQQALVWRIGERIADEVEKVAAGRQSDCEAAAGDIYAMLATAPSAEACEWPNGRTFGFHDDPGEHDPCYVIMPDGAMLPFNHHAAPGVDIARARFVQAACNAALASSTPESGVYPDWRPIETAPKDGTHILLHFVRKTGRLEGVWQAFWENVHGETTPEDGSWCVDDNKHGPYPLRGWCDGDIAHWMPLPAAPTEARSEQAEGEA